MIRALIFDMDGTLIDNMGVHIAVWLEILAEFGVEMSEMAFHTAVAGMTNLETLRQLVDPAMTEAEAEAIAQRKESRYRERYRPLLAPLAGLLPFLQQAQQAGVPLAVATAAGQANIEFVMNGLQLWNYFDAIVGADDVARGKPHPDLFLLAAERLGLPPEQCLVFEDSMSGIEASRRAGMPVVAVTTSHGPEELGHLLEVRQIIPDYTDLRLNELLG